MTVMACALDNCFSKGRRLKIRANFRSTLLVVSVLIRPTKKGKARKYRKWFIACSLLWQSLKNRTLSVHVTKLDCFVPDEFKTYKQPHDSVGLFD